MRRRQPGQYGVGRQRSGYERFMNEWGGIISLLIVVLVLVVLLYGAPRLISYLECKAKTADIGFPMRHSYFGGCQIEVMPGQWIPLERYYFKQE